MQSSYKSSSGTTAGGARDVSPGEKAGPAGEAGRGSKSLSPRAHALAQSSAQTIKGSGFAAGPGLGLEDLQSKFNQVVEENRTLRKEILNQQQ